MRMGWDEQSGDVMCARLATVMPFLMILSNRNQILFPSWPAQTVYGGPWAEVSREGAAPPTRTCCGLGCACRCRSTCGNFTSVTSTFPPRSRLRRGRPPSTSALNSGCSFTPNCPTCRSKRCTSVEACTTICRLDLTGVEFLLYLYDFGSV